MSSGSSSLLPTQRTITLSRCCSLNGSILSTLVPLRRPGIGSKAISAASYASRPVLSAAYTGASDTKSKGTSHGSLADEHPDLALQWAPEGNGSQTPQSVSAASHFKAAWRCGRGCEHCGRPHEWTARVADRSLLSSGCPLCSGYKVCRCHSVAALHPELMKQWHWEDNQDIDPYSVGCHSEKKISWKCAEHGLWIASPDVRVSGKTGCPKCARLRRVVRGAKRRGLVKDEMPEVYAELHPTKNAGIDIEKLTCGSKKKVWWLCQDTHCRPAGCQHSHEWEVQVAPRCSPTNPTGCPFCTGKLVCPCNSLAELQPALLQYWDFAANAIPLAQPLDPSWLGLNSNKKVWWRHECNDRQTCRWTAKVENVSSSFMAKGRVPCPRCAQSGPRRKLIKRTDG